MKITTIEIRNVKGIKHKSFAVEILPNKPNLLVAPNGFGKSSIATAFSSMNSRRMTLDGEDFYQEDESNVPELAITINDERLVADSSRNEIRQSFDVTVIKSGLKPKATKRRMGGFTSATASLEIQSIPLLNIPSKAAFDYKVSDLKVGFGTNGKVLPNLTTVTCSPLFCKVIAGVKLRRVAGQRIQDKISKFTNLVNQQTGNADQVFNWIVNSSLNELRAIPVLCDLAANLSRLGLSTSEAEAFLAAYQIIEMYKANKRSFEAACQWLEYAAVKNDYENLLNHLCSSSWKRAYLVEDKKQKILSVNFPKARQLSNGQRDLVTLVVQMHKALYEGSRKPLILVIDEVFDYLDDANLVAFQYYVTNLIEAYKQHGQQVYPVILTHLDPGVFFDFCFNKHKLRITYLQAIASPKSKDILKLIKARDGNSAIKDHLERYWFHFHPNPQIIGEIDWPSNLPKEWRDPTNFHRYVTDEGRRYLSEQSFDPLAICFALRIQIEKIAFSFLSDSSHELSFLRERTTKRKMNLVAERGLDVPEIHFLLGLIYNTNLHWRAGRDYISPLMTRLTHPTIRNMISQVLS